MLRNNSYDSLSITISTLKTKLKEKENLIIKSDDSSTWQAAVDANNEVNDTCSELYEKFKALKQDFHQGKIVLARYRSHLDEIQELLTGVDEPLKNENLNVQEMVKEIKIYN